jgi:hypothetical protein
MKTLSVSAAAQMMIVPEKPVSNVALVDIGWIEF